ncbi:MAG: hypothetical protein A3G01_03405 [Candidatus Kerfeldbacteria bacterium RIFCSPLOWO2_12_FULL_43_9]|nr:MAG: hypothetical protein A3G01_03405 [Candidatus Kerfeldbacteria bacterium RIFCSPLOWO2_12_FULL_43_9]
MMIVTFFRATKFAFQNFWRNFWLSIVTIFILTLTLVSVSLLSAVNLLANQAITVVKEKVNIDVFFSSAAQAEQMLAVRAFVEQMPEAKQVEYVSATEALERFKKEHVADLDILASLAELEENPLPASLVIQAYELDQYQTIIDKLRASSFADILTTQDFDDNRSVIQRISILSQRVTQIGLVLSFIFATISLLMVFNTIRITIYTHREELNIMKLVGATNWFIRTPFFLEGILYAMIASIVTMAFLYPTFVFVSPYIQAFFQGYSFDFIQFLELHFWKIFALQIGLSLVLSVLSSMIAITRYLRV